MCLVLFLDRRPSMEAIHRFICTGDSRGGLAEEPGGSCPLPKLTGGLGGDRGRDRRDAREDSQLSIHPVAVVLCRIKLHIGVGLYQIPPSLQPTPVPHPPVTMVLPTFISQYPGILWILFSLPKIIAPAFIVYASISYSLGLLVGWEALDGSKWKVALASALAFPIGSFFSITWTRLRVTHRARSRGATSPPVIAGRLPGSLDIVWRIAKARFTAYPGELVLPVVCQAAVAPVIAPSLFLRPQMLTHVFNVG